MDSLLRIPEQEYPDHPGWARLRKFMVTPLFEKKNMILARLHISDIINKCAVNWPFSDLEKFYKLKSKTMWLRSFILLGWLGYPNLIAGIPLKTASSDNSPIVDLGYAKYEGTYLDVGVNQFLGMRYAAPPLGDLRWREPEDPVHQDGVQPATEVKNIPIFIRLLVHAHGPP